MDAGRFESSPRPFNLHRAISSVVGGIGVSTAAKGLDLHVELDPRIDDISNDLAEGEKGQDGDGLWVVGDEIRLRQVLTNLTSNAVKFTPEHGGSIKVLTKLISPTGTTRPASPAPATEPHALDHAHPYDKEMRAALAEEGKAPPRAREHERRLVFRLEVHDSGPGIRPSDLVDNRLFQPFVQTKVGKLSGKGSGLGLAIVRQIVHLSGGRLGVQSRKGRGAVFWVELAYAIATPAEARAARANSALLPTPPARVEPEIGRGLAPALAASAGLPVAPAPDAKAKPSAWHNPASYGSGTSGKSEATTTDSEFPPSMAPVELRMTTPLPRYVSFVPVPAVRLTRRGGTTANRTRRRRASRRRVRRRRRLRCSRRERAPTTR
jgi:hypothetical protein